MNKLVPLSSPSPVSLLGETEGPAQLNIVTAITIFFIIIQLFSLLSVKSINSSNILCVAVKNPFPSVLDCTALTEKS